MKFNIIKHIFLFLAFLLTVSSSAARDSLCTPGEKIFFSCDLAKKTVSLCVSNNSSPSPYMEYRFGTSEKVELRHKGKPAPDFGFSRAEITYASNAETAIWFKNQEVSYVLHFPMRGGPMLEVVKNGNTIAEMSCSQGWTHAIGDPQAPSSFIEKKPDGNYVQISENWK